MGRFESRRSSPEKPMVKKAVVAFWGGFNNNNNSIHPMHVIHHQQQSLKLTLLLAASVILLSTGLSQAQIQDRPVAGPEQKKMAIHIGTWEYQGTLKDTPLGPGGKFSGRNTATPALDNLFVETRGEDKGTYGGKDLAYKYSEMQWYDPASKTYMHMSFDNDGIVGKSTSTVNGDTWTDSGSMTDSKGTTYRTRTTTTYSPDGNSSVTKGELSTDDGKTWMPYWESTAKKVSK
jgi:hypothetical protein